MKTKLIKTFSHRQKNKINSLNFSTSVCYSFVFYLFVFCTACKKDINEIKFQNESSDINKATLSGRPNIIIILGDDIGYDAITSQGNQSFQTPNLDAMAASGMRFTQCHGSPLCSPSRVMFVTGKYNFRNYKEWGVLDPREKTFGNLMKKAGYSTYVAGKWQLNGGDASIRGFGFDNYCVWNPSKDDRPGSHYKNPLIYTHGAFLPMSATANQYGDDIFTDSVLSFIQKNKSNNFFVWFPITLCHYPYCPTPDDREFKSWDSKGNPSDTKYFPSMIKYMDKKIGQIIDSLKIWNLYNNTILMFVGDNGTPHHIFYYYNGVLTEGAKSNSTEGGTHVTMIATWPNKITAPQVNRNLIDFTDFLPTLADAAGIAIPSNYGTIDGHSFYGQLAGTSYTPRDWIFCHYQPFTNNGNDKLKRWTQDTTYKLYDSTGKFYNIVSDPLEKNPITHSQMTAKEKSIAKEFQSIMDSLK